MTKKNLLCFLFSLFSMTLTGLCLTERVARAEEILWDTQAGFATRSLPFGAKFFAELGHNTRLWGDSAQGDVMYGFLRPSAKLESSALVSRGIVQLDVFPISFLGFHGGHAQSFRSTDFDTIDCTVVICRGRLARTYFGVSAAVGWKAWSLGGSWQWNIWKPGVGGQPFAEERSALVGQAGGDNQIAADLFLNWDLFSGFAVGGLWSREKFVGNRTANELLGGYLSKKDGNWSYTIGAARYESSTQPAGLSFLGQVKWTGAPSLKLF